MTAVRAVPAGAGLTSWHEEATSAGAVSDFLAHPGAPEAIRTCLRAVLGLYRGDRLLNLIVNDRGRLVTANCALWLHFSYRADDPRSGLAAKRLRDLLVREGVASRGRVMALIALMQWGGYIKPAGSPSTPQRLVATDKLIALHVDRWRVLLEAAIIVSPELRPALPALSDPSFIAAYTRYQAEAYRGGLRLLHAAPELRPFSERNAGLLILCKLAGGHFESNDHAAASVSALAKQFHVSRPHVIELLRAAEAVGLVARTASGAPVATQALVTSVHGWSAALLLFNAAVAGRALAELRGRATH